MSHNSNYAYKYRIKVSGLGVKTTYKRTLLEILDYITEYNDGIIFIDIASKSFQRYAAKFAQTQCDRNFSLVFLTDNYVVDIECDNIFTFKSDYNNIQHTLEEIKLKRFSRKNIISKVSKQDFENCLNLITTELGFPISKTGTGYIKDCVNILLNSRDKKYNIIKDVYSVVARRYNKSVENIEKSIRSALATAIEQNIDLYTNLFGTQKVTNRMVINYISNKIKDTLRTDYSQN